MKIKAGKLECSFTPKPLNLFDKYFSTSRHFMYALDFKYYFTIYANTITMFPF